MKKFFFFILVLFVFILNLTSQALLKIHSADLLKQNLYGGKVIYGNVDIEYDIYRIKCDSAVINKDMSNARLFRNIEFSDTSRTINCNRATLSKSESGKTAYLLGDIRITEKDFLITGKEASMNELNNKVTVTDSVIVKYYKFPSVLYCYELEFETKNNIIKSLSVDSVLAVDSLRYYKLFTKYFTYNTETSVLDLTGKYDLESHDFSTPVGSYMDIDPAAISKTVKQYDIIKDGYFSAGRGKFNFDIFDIETDGKCTFRQIDRTVPDTLFFKADKIFYSDSSQVADAVGMVSIKKDKMKIDTEHAKYLLTDHIVKFLKLPLVTYENSKITGDSISLSVDESDFYPKEATIYGNPYFESVPDSSNSSEINFLKGKLMNVWFLNKEISKIIVSKEAEGVYFVVKDKQKNSEASNYLLGDEIEINFIEGNIDNASVKSGCEGIYYPDKLKLNALKTRKK